MLERRATAGQMKKRENYWALAVSCILGQGLEYC